MRLRSIIEHFQDAVDPEIILPPERCRGCGSDEDVSEEYTLCRLCTGRREAEVGRIIADLATNGPATALQLSKSAHVPVSVATAYLRGGAEAAMRARAPLPMDEGSPMQVRDHIHRRVEADLADLNASAGHH